MALTVNHSDLAGSDFSSCVIFNLRAAAGSCRSLHAVLRTSFCGGAVAGLAVTALSLLGVTGLFYAYGGAANPEKAPLLLGGFGFGARFVVLFACAWDKYREIH